MTVAIPFRFTWVVHWMPPALTAHSTPLPPGIENQFLPCLIHGGRQTKDEDGNYRKRPHWWAVQEKR